MQQGYVSSLCCGNRALHRQFRALMTANIDAKGKKIGYEYDESGKLTANNFYSGTDSASYSLVTSETNSFDIMDRFLVARQIWFKKINP